jgi:hypothetical protein
VATRREDDDRARRVGLSRPTTQRASHGLRLADVSRPSDERFELAILAVWRRDRVELDHHRSLVKTAIDGDPDPPKSLSLVAGDVRAGLMSIGDAAGRISFVVIAPFLAFSLLMGFATFQHHTHPRVIWYATEEEWSFFGSQVEGTVHVVFPRWIELLLHNIMEHTAHHVDTRIPLYHLNNAQQAVEAAFGTEHVITEQFSFAGMSRCFVNVSSMITTRTSG